MVDGGIPKRRLQLRRGIDGLLELVIAVYLRCVLLVDNQSQSCDAEANGLAF